MSKFYWTGVGTRPKNMPSPSVMQSKMTEIAAVITEAGGWCRSGDADGSDLAWENGCNGHADVYLPWKSKKNRTSPPANRIIFTELDKEHQARLISEMTKALKPSLTEGHFNAIMNNSNYKKLHARNVCQILGHESKFVPSRFLLFCAEPISTIKWKGGTNTAVQVARRYKVPYFNLWTMDWTELDKFLQKHLPS